MPGTDRLQSLSSFLPPTTHQYLQLTKTLRYLYLIFRALTHHRKMAKEVEN